MDIGLVSSLSLWRTRSPSVSVSRACGADHQQCMYETSLPTPHLYLVLSSNFCRADGWEGLSYDLFVLPFTMWLTSSVTCLFVVPVFLSWSSPDPPFREFSVLCDAKTLSQIFSFFFALFKLPSSVLIEEITAFFLNKILLLSWGHKHPLSFLLF